MKNNKSNEAFFALIRAGLWEHCEFQVSSFKIQGEVDWGEVYRLASEQSVLGLVLAGIDYLPNDQRLPKMELLQWIGEIQMLEQQNMAMNFFISVIVEKMRAEGIYTLLVKGQGVAQCYSKPLWRASGDVDLLLDKENYFKAIDFLTPLSSKAELQDKRNMAYGITIEPHIIELHSTLRCGLSRAMDKEIDAIQKDTLAYNHVRIWKNEGVEVMIPAPNNDVFFIFTHIIKHFYKGGIGLRQICDLSQLLWCYRDEMDSDLLLERLRRMKLYDEWRAFASFIVEYLGHPKDAMPLYSPDVKWKRKADRICLFVMKVGNFGHNRDNSYYSKYPYVIRKTISLCQRLGDLFHHARIFPLDSLRFFPTLFFNGLKSALKGEG